MAVTPEQGMQRWDPCSVLVNLSSKTTEFHIRGERPCLEKIVRKWEITEEEHSTVVWLPHCLHMRTHALSHTKAARLLCIYPSQSPEAF